MKKLPDEEKIRRLKEQRHKYYIKNKEQINKKSVEYQLKHRKEISKQRKEYWNKNKDKLSERRRIRYNEVDKKNPELMKKKLHTSLEWQKKSRKQCIEHYSKGKNCCEICGENDYDVLTIDHINGGGNQERKRVAQHVTRHLIKNNFPEGYRILCMNCNLKEARRKGSFMVRENITQRDTDFHDTNASIDLARSWLQSKCDRVNQFNTVIKQQRKNNGSFKKKKERWGDAPLVKS